MLKPLAIDFAPTRKTVRPAGWLASGAGAVLLVVAGFAWLPPAHVEASHMTEASQRQRVLPDGDSAQAVDMAVRELNLPWLAVLDALNSEFGPGADAVLLQVDTDVRRAIVRLEGAANDAAVVQGYPARLRALGPIAEATLVGQEVRGDAQSHHSRPVRFVIELRMREGT